MTFDKHIPDLDKPDEKCIRSKQHTSRNLKGHIAGVGSQDVRKSFMKTCRPVLSAQHDESQALTGKAISYQTEEGGLGTSNTASSASMQSPNDFCEEGLQDTPAALMIPSLELGTQFPPDSGIKSKSSKNFRCEHCSKTFTRLYNLKSHLVTHDRTMPYSCNICNRAFARKSDSKRHMRTHSGEKNWVCGGCRTSFARRDMLSSHHKSHKGQACLRRQQSQGVQRDDWEKSQSPKILSISSLLS
ncbi:hypothetical protein PEBR_11237 [Penicillium brasilianum]|uniref:C2H2-type domain-containing protein n=1 Tax=Penicillium brasilianum TaxID=104259 RepID=A0A1S9RTA6_PENBI|nr:hypothetical protein PEBR_11237 [Penicillium brasilianum]